MKNVYSAEIYRLKRIKSSYVILLIYAVAVAINVVVAISKGDASIALAGESFSSIFLMLAIVGITTSTFESHTLKNILSSGNTRKEIYLGKLLCTGAVTLAYIIVAIIGAVVGFVVYAIMNGGFDASHFGGADAGFGDVIIKILLGSLTMILFALLFFGISMLFRTSKISYNVCTFVAILAPLVQGMIATMTKISLISELNLTLDLGAQLTAPQVSATVYISVGIFVALGVIFNVLAYIRMKKTED
ncbi:MAG: ABC transporter permease subunit [Clostridia bacterium]|nr:ABC transporter permease subunit [Clostridia bacterium]